MIFFFHVDLTVTDWALNIECITNWGAGIAHWQSARLKVKRLQVQIPAGAAGKFSTPKLTFYADFYLVFVPPLLLQWHIKDTSKSAKRAIGRLHLKKHTLLIQQSQSGLTMLSTHSVGTYQGNELICNLSGNTWPQSSQLAEPLWADPGLKSGISVCELMFT